MQPFRTRAALFLAALTLVGPWFAEARSPGFPRQAPRATAEEVAQASPASLELLSIQPPAGSPVTRETELIAEFAYTIEQFEPGRFVIGPTFSTIDETIDRIGDAGFVEPLLGRASGRVTMKFPLGAIWDVKEVRKPLRAQFCIRQRIGTMGAAIAAACLPRMTFPTRE